MNLYLPDEAATLAFAARLAENLKSIRLITLTGDLGAGKTALVRGMLQSLGHKGKVKSPTFTLVEPYTIQGRQVYHFDLYRLADPEELEYLGFSDYFAGNSLCLIEWPERGRGWLPTADLEITLLHRESGRDIKIEARTAAGNEVLQVLAGYQAKSDKWL